MFDLNCKTICLALLFPVPPDSFKIEWKKFVIRWQHFGNKMLVCEIKMLEGSQNAS